MVEIPSFNAVIFADGFEMPGTEDMLKVLLTSPTTC